MVRGRKRGVQVARREFRTFEVALDSLVVADFTDEPGLLRLRRVSQNERARATLAVLGHPDHD